MTTEEVWDYTKSAAGGAGMWVQGAGSGLLLAAIPLLVTGLAIGTALLLLKLPIRALGGDA